MLAFDTGVNITIGLSITRTSPDHGRVRHRGRRIASDGSALEAMKVACRLCRAKTPLRFCRGACPEPGGGSPMAISRAALLNSCSSPSPEALTNRTRVVLPDFLIRTSTACPFSPMFFTGAYHRRCTKQLLPRE